MAATIAPTINELICNPRQPVCIRAAILDLD